MEHQLPGDGELVSRGSNVRAKATAGIFGVAMIVATLSPVVENWRAEPKDNFPLSYYPMFSAKRGEAYTVHYLVGLDAADQRHVISHKMAGKGGFNSTRRQINKMVRESKSKELCRTVAAKVATSKDPALAAVTTVQVVTGSYRFDDYFHGNKAAINERVRATFKVDRGGA